MAPCNIDDIGERDIALQYTNTAEQVASGNRYNQNKKNQSQNGVGKNFYSHDDNKDEKIFLHFQYLKLSERTSNLYPKQEASRV